MKCPRCDGTGRIVIGPPLSNCDGPQYGPCPDCGGTGTIAGQPSAARGMTPEFVRQQAVDRIDWVLGHPTLTWLSDDQKRMLKATRQVVETDDDLCKRIADLATSLEP